MNISTQEIIAFSKYILDISGIYLDERKGYLLENRLQTLMSECRAQSYDMLLDQIKADASKRLEIRLVDAITTNETFFFRDDIPFDLLRNKIIPDLIDLRRKQYSSGAVPIKVWSAGCSTGQEVYSIVITLIEMLSGQGDYEISVFGTDISDEAVARASYGKYNRFEVERGLPHNMRDKYFSRSADSWQIKDEVRSLVRFGKMNLLRPFPLDLGTYDIVFCRNVAIYFQHSDKIKLFEKIAKTLMPGGSLLVGGSENISGIAPDFISRQYQRGIFYQLQNGTQPGKSHPVQKTAVQPVKKAVSEVRRNTVHDRPKRRAKADNSTPAPTDLITKGQKKTAPSARKDVPAESFAQVAEDHRQTPVSLREKLAKYPNSKSKASLLASLETKHGNSMALFGSNQGRSLPKQSLLEKISHLNKKKIEEAS